MKKKILIFNMVLITAALLVMLFSGISVNKSSHLKEAEKEVIAITQIYKENYSETITENVPENVRVTIIGADKKVIKDSEDTSLVGTLHDNREEITAAWEGNPKVVKRYSESLKKTFVYYAEKVEVGESFVIVRAAIPVESIETYVNNTIPTMIYVLIIALVISGVVVAFGTNGILKPLKVVKGKLISIKDGEFKSGFESSGDKDVDIVLKDIDNVGEKLQDTIQEVKTDKERLDYILGNISDGIVVIGEDGIVRVMNKISKEIFKGEGYLNRNYEALCADKGFLDTISNSITNKESSDTIFESDGRIYKANINYLENDYVVIVLTDITEVKNAEKMRSEFFDNASHELKTPLTAIKGFNDLISMKTTDEDIKEFTAKTDKELSRILVLISDMLNLSKLETNKIESKEKVSLKEVAEDVKNSLSKLAEDKKVNIEISGDATIDMDKEHAVELIKNLVENGVRYNNVGGFVKVNIIDDKKSTKLIVEDNGIGIEEEHQARIFERFYRVNKSRSRETGGTGLGLAIVKHICLLYKADIELKSKYGVGTTITVTFNK